MSPALIGFVFQETGCRHALEDRFLCDWSACAMAVADGVTRFNYGTDSEAESARVGQVAFAFCATAVELLSSAGRHPELIERAGPEANRQIATINRSYGFSSADDYSSRDPYAAVGCCGVLSEGFWHFGYIGDCEVRMLSADGRNTALSDDQLIGTCRVLQSLAHLPRQEQARILRRDLRNRVEAKDTAGRPCGHGVFNGDPRADAWWRCGSVRAEPGGIFVLSTDGGRALIRSNRFAALVRGILECSQPGAEGPATCRQLWAELAAANPADCADDVTVIVAGPQ
ncbi:MAG: protein phosphatase 2C domain-containing protein [Verrucomicrobiia bacterium]